MKLPADTRFLAQVAQYQLRFACEHCAQYQPADESCAHGFPTREHRLARHGGAEVVFCKDFELG